MSTLTLDLKFRYLDTEPKMTKTKSKPKVLILGRLLADRSVIEKLEQVAELHTIPPIPAEEVVDTIKAKVKKDGPFEAVAVSVIHRRKVL